MLEQPRGPHDRGSLSCVEYREGRASHMDGRAGGEGGMDANKVYVDEACKAASNREPT